MSIVYAWGILVLLGVGLTLGTYVAYRIFVKGKIICYIYTKDKGLYRRALRPDSSGLLHIRDKTYTYNENRVLTTTGFLLKERFPALIYEEGKPNPIDMYGPDKRPSPLGDEDISSTELTQILNDGTVRDFVNAQSKISLTQVTYVILGAAALSALVTIATGYWIKGVDLLSGGG